LIVYVSIIMSYVELLRLCCCTTTMFIISFFFPDPATTEIYTLSLHDALPISVLGAVRLGAERQRPEERAGHHAALRRGRSVWGRSEEHTSELQSRENLVCRLLLEKKKCAELLQLSLRGVGCDL